MPDRVKEKLVELLYEIHSKLTDECCLGGKDMSYAEQVGAEADHLIANGVTVVDKFATTEQEWISVKDRLPDKHTDVLVCQTNGKVLKGWLGSADRWFAPGIVTHWMPLPQPPKGE